MAEDNDIPAPGTGAAEGLSVLTRYFSANYILINFFYIFNFYFSDILIFYLDFGVKILFFLFFLFFT